MAAADKRAASRLAFVIVGLLASIVALAILASMARPAFSEQGITYRTRRLSPGEAVVLAGTGVRVVVPARWTGVATDSFSFQRWLDPHTLFAPHRLLISPDAGNRELQIGWGSDSRDWSGVRQSTGLARLTASRDLASAGVRTILLRRRADVAGAADAYLLVDSREGRYVITVGLDRAASSVTTRDVEAALAACGFTFH